MTSTPALTAATCLGRTCLHWTPDGELDPEDLRGVLNRLAAVEVQRPSPQCAEPPVA